ncbi:GNAT family N-acetyltransferase [Virgibacillus siamensis]|uniref:GNAT family N-acetyltransferase n=1 Tax=Virgibacillus siamensis TaxID=480071 RepID=UPI00158C667B|nr:GNAT family N-acetyltransferase [Virgibacillus siamensis]
MNVYVHNEDINMRQAAVFISELNQSKMYHIGFCDTGAEAILTGLQNDVTKMTAVVENGEMIGFIGADTYDDVAEVWGPFAAPGNDLHLALMMWDKLFRKLPESVKKVVLFPNVENRFVYEFAQTLDFELKTNQYILKLSQHQLKDFEDESLSELGETDFDGFIAMHDAAFPETYYSGKEIIARHNEIQKVFILKEADRLAGYVYVEADPDHAEGSIEFIAVDPMIRGKGYGKRLLSAAVRWLFTFDSISEIDLCVAADNAGAIGLYQSIGFYVENELHFFRKNVY